MANSVGAGVLALGAMVPSLTGDGAGPTPSEFLEVMGQVSQMGKCKMVGKAYSFAWRNELMKAVKTYAAFKELVLKRYDNEPDSVKLEKYLTARQEANEDVRGFASRLRGLGVKTLRRHEGADAEQVDAAAQSMLLRQLLFRFVNGLRDPVRRFVLSSDPATFEEAVEVAAKEERNERLVASSSTVRALEKREEQKEVVELSQRMDRLEMLLAESIAWQKTAHEQKFSHDMAGRARMRCWYCNRVGHRSRDCRLKAETERETPSSDGRPRFKPRAPEETLPKESNHSGN
uniref:CCHC-type domain-containing protein n=1 Tax=Ixodes ricinus TaxID=34613 RepID=A0A6B0V7F9_IXORI